MNKPAAGQAGAATSKAPTLLVLAAGMGSRYGGLKQIEPVGPAGQTLLDYGVQDAIRAGFGRIVFVIRRDFEEAFRATVVARLPGTIPVAFAYQSLDDLPQAEDRPEGIPAQSARLAPAAGTAGLPGGPVRPLGGRTKPWGTGHAVWCARNVVDGPFAVINADDFYGRDAFLKLAAFLGAASGTGYALAGFRLDRTLSEHGAVARGVCRVGDGRLLSIREVTGITTADVGPGRRFTGAETVSMNCWGFTPALFPALGEAFAAFLAGSGADPKAEFQLPGVISELIAKGGATAEVLAVEGDWFGVTYKEDRPRVVAALARLPAPGQ